MKIIRLLPILILCGCATAKVGSSDPSKVQLPPLPKMMSLPDGTLAPVRIATKSVVQKATLNPLNVNVSFVGKIGVDYALANTNGVFFVTEATNLVQPAMLKAIKSAPAPKRIISKSNTAIIILPNGFGQSISYSEWQSGQNVAYVVTTNLIAGKTYYQQATLDLVNYSNTGNNVAWTSSDPTAFWGTIRLVPEFDLFHEFYRIMTP